MIEDKKIRQLCEIICRALESNATRDEVAYLEEMLHADERVLELYDYITDIHARLMCPGQPVAANSDESNQRRKFDLKVLEMMLDEEMHAPTYDIPSIIARPEPKEILTVSSKKNSILSYAGIIISIAAVLMILILVHMDRTSKVPVATIKDSFQAKWKTASVVKSKPLARSKYPMELFSGVIKLEFDNGAEVIVEGPASFLLESPDQMRLAYGKISAYVPAIAAGFRVNTPNMAVTDLGTEFTIDVDRQGEAVVNLYTGSAVVTAGQEGHRIGTDVLTPGQARKVNSSGDKIETVVFDTNRITRNFDSGSGFIWNGRAISIASVIAGKEIFGIADGVCGIDPLEGFFVEEYRKKLLKSTGKYTPVSINQYIDGVFIPDSSFGDNIISSANHIFENCPDTAGTRSHNDFGENSHDILVFCGYNHEDVALRQNELPIFNEFDAGTKEQPAVLLHSNAGITFDLDAIRKEISVLKIKQFISSYGLPNKQELNFADARLTVLIDGKTRFVKEYITPKDDIGNLVVDIEPQDRFLTIAVTDNQENTFENTGAIDNDYVYLISPELKLANDR